MKYSSKRTFTLIEMLIVIVIIGILAAALIPRLQSLNSRARDTRRKTDLQSIYTALEVYMADNGNYPIARWPLAYDAHWNFTCNAGTGMNSPCRVWSCFVGTNWLYPLGGTYMTSVPADPINNPQWGQYCAYGAWNTGEYSYAYGRVRGGSNTPQFDLAAKLENPNDPDRCAVKNYKAGTNGGYAICNGGSAYQWYQNGQIYEYSPYSN